MLKLIVKKAEYYSKANERYECLDCRIQFNHSSIDWKDFKQKIFNDFEVEISKDSLVENEGHGYSVNGFMIPWTCQYALKEAINQGLLEKGEK